MISDTPRRADAAPWPTLPSTARLERGIGELIKEAAVWRALQDGTAAAILRLRDGVALSAPPSTVAPLRRGGDPMGSPSTTPEGRLTDGADK